MNVILESFGVADQGPLFWVAAASVALGVTMVVVASVIQARRLARPDAAASAAERTARTPVAEPPTAMEADPSARRADSPRRRERPVEETRQADRLRQNMERYDTRMPVRARIGNDVIYEILPES